MGRIVLLLVLAAAGIFLWWQLSGQPPQIQLRQEIKGIGRSTPVSIAVEDRRGLIALRVELEQGGQTIPVLSESYGSRWSFWRSGPRELTREVVIGTAQQNQLQDGQVELHIIAQNKSWFSSQVSFSQTLPVRSRPPTLENRSGLLYVSQGGSEIVLYRVSSSAVSSGVKVGSYFFPGYPLPGGEEGSRFALFAFPHDVARNTPAVIVAQDEVGNEAQANFPYRVLPKNFRHRDIELTDQFLQATVPGILAQTPELKDQGDLLKNFLMVNSTLRQRNRQKIMETSQQTLPEFLWEGPFLQLSNTAVESQFADYRSYIYQGKKVDEQVHLGFDLASVQHAPVVASNSGRVVFAEYLGIFGNTIILDHGFGLQSLYAHLNSFQVKVGDKVSKGQVIAESDSTGLAGGDHLHFTMLLAGVEVNPMEWWDPLWVQQHILERLKSARGAS
ncbi:MAG: M23 family metallopeptidase [Acidobacteria bacterium]|nr:M23 family metallopeptidase [Acidobacteriota bacterium]